jgi:hypothetical protein
VARQLSALFALMLVTSGCPDQGGAEGGSRSSDPQPDPITHPCVVTAAQFDIEVRDGDKSCRSDADCECFPNGVGSKNACGGVTSKKSATKLRELALEYAKMKCTSQVECAKRACLPRCNGGTCQ